MRIPTLTDGVVVLDGHTLADVSTMVEREDEELARRFGWWPARSTQRNGQAAVQRWEQQWRTGGSTRAFAVREAPTGTLIGACEIRLAEEGTAAMSYALFRAHRGRGYATRAVRLVRDFAFTELGVKLLELHIAADNLASRGVAHGAGFRRAAGPARHGQLRDNEILYHLSDTLPSSA